MIETSTTPKPPVKSTGNTFTNVCLWFLAVFALSVVGKAVTWAMLNSMDPTGKIDWANLFMPK